MSRCVTILAACLALAAAAFVGLAVEAPARAAKPVRVTNTAGKLSVTVPAGWQVDRSGTLGATLFLFGPQYEDFRTNVNVIEQQVGKMSLADYLAVTKESGPRLMPEFRVLSEGWTTLGGLRAVELVYEAKPLTKRVRCMAVFTIKDSTAYILTYTALPSYYAKHVKDFRAVVKSLAWTSRGEAGSGAPPAK